MSKVIYLQKRDFETYVEPRNDPKSDDILAKLLGIGGMLLVYGLCRLVNHPGQMSYYLIYFLSYF